MKTLVLLSGGLDSSTCLAMAVNKNGADNVIALSLYYGQKHDKEIKSAKDIANFYHVKHIEFDVSKIFENSDCSLIKGNADVPAKSYKEQIDEANGNPVTTYVPFRNGLFLAIAASYAMSNGCNKIIYGAHKDDAAGNAYPDCSIDFHSAISRAVNVGSGGAAEIYDPFITCNKSDIVRKGIAIGVPYELTWSCYNGGDKPCGKCGTCRDRIKAFEINGAKDPLKY